MAFATLPVDPLTIHEIGEGISVRLVYRMATNASGCIDPIVAWITVVGRQCPARRG